MKATGNVPTGHGSDNPDDILARLASLTEMRLTVAEDVTLGCITIDIQGLLPGLNCILASNSCPGPRPAPDTSLRPPQQGPEREEAKGPPNLGPGSLSGSY